MIDPTAPVASWFLLLVGAFFLVVYALPLLLAPLRWAKVFLWQIPAETQLTVYFGRCLGATALGSVFVVFRAAGAPRAHPLVFELLIVAGVLLTLVHVVGALRREQPWTETLEIALYAGATAGAVWVYAGLRH